MITTSMKRDLSEEDKREVRENSRARELYVMDALRSLEYLHRREESAEVVLDVLRQEAQYFTPIPACYRRHDALHSPPSKSVSPMRAITANSEYEDRLASRSPPGAFRVPVERALPISYEAQCDIRRVTGERRKSSLHLTSGYAPLFTHSSSHGREPSPEEEEHLRFLHPPPENPKTRVQHKLEEKHAFDKKCDPNLKKRMNEPKKYPNLNKKVSRKFVPACTDQPTYAYAAHCQGNSERTHSAKEANNRARWRN